jgi:hypothetical protein
MTRAPTYRTPEALIDRVLALYGVAPTDPDWQQSLLAAMMQDPEHLAIIEKRLFPKKRGPRRPPASEDRQIARRWAAFPHGGKSAETLGEAFTASLPTHLRAKPNKLSKGAEQSGKRYSNQIGTGDEKISHRPMLKRYVAALRAGGGMEHYPATMTLRQVIESVIEVERKAGTFMESRALEHLTLEAEAEARSDAIANPRALFTACRERALLGDNASGLIHIPQR